jgi:urease accessory protein
MERDSTAMRQGRPFLLTSLVVDPAATEVAAWVLDQRDQWLTGRP